MKILYCAAEAAPLIKIGGLGDVAGTLPKALQGLGDSVILCIPYYDAIKHKNFAVSELTSFTLPLGEKNAETVKIFQTSLPNTNIPVLLVGNDHYIGPGGKAAYEGTITETDRFLFFQLAITAMFSQSALANYFKDLSIIHCNDWHTALLPILYPETQPRPAFVLTIHNVAYQGINDFASLHRFGIAEHMQKQLVYEGTQHDINFLKQGILAADLINTVSENYANELQTPQFGGGLDAIFRQRAQSLRGILNGIDYDYWNPKTDPALVAHYEKVETEAAIQAAKKTNKTALQKQLGLPITDQPLIGFIGRIEPNQKGIDLIVAWLETNPSNMQVVILGTGDRVWEDHLRRLTEDRRLWFSAQLTFNEQLAHSIYAGADFILMPSKFEPGGLPQMIAQHYGTLPIVHAVGGLKDTVTPGKTGFTFTEYTVAGLSDAVVLATQTYQSDRYWQMIGQAMAADYSWRRSAEKYQQMYTDALKKETA